MALRHWLQLSLTEGIGPILTRRLVDAAGGAAAACGADVDLLNNVEGIGLSKSRKIAAGLRAAAGEVDRELERASGQKITILCPDDQAYPPLLRNIPDPPTVLYARGTIEPRDLNAVAIVGSRRCSMYGREQAERFGSLLAGAGFTVISGGARGVDSSAHRGAMAHPHGRTIAVLGSGLDVPYPPENAPLFAQIAGQGAVLSEFALGTPPNKENFPRRNRIVSGMSRGVLVVEADERSGALITARQACDDHGRPVFAMPGRVDNPLSAGPHQLIRDGAILAARLEDILDGLTPLPDDVAEPTLFPEPDAVSSELAPGSSPTTDPAPAMFDGMSERQRIVYSALGPDPSSVDVLVESTALPAHVVLQELTFLTLKGHVRRVDGQRFARR
ncbi:MAG TPA: DNA-processing protein DprA [Tepidisphaeraceae bacterium]